LAAYSAGDEVEADELKRILCPNIFLVIDQQIRRGRYGSEMIFQKNFHFFFLLSILFFRVVGRSLRRIFIEPCKSVQYILLHVTLKIVLDVNRRE